jgi:hypothetical protein
MIVTEPIFTKLMFLDNFFAKNPFTEFHVNPTTCLVTDTKSQMDKTIWSAH